MFFCGIFDDLWIPNCRFFVVFFVVFFAESGDSGEKLCAVSVCGPAS